MSPADGPRGELDSFVLRLMERSEESVAREDTMHEDLRDVLLAVVAALDAFDRLGVADGTVAEVPATSVRMIARDLERACADAGMTPYARPGEVIDDVVATQRHVVAGTRPATAVPGEILEVEQRGWSWEGVSLRPSRVVIADDGSSPAVQQEPSGGQTP